MSVVMVLESRSAYLVSFGTIQIDLAVQADLRAVAMLPVSEADLRWGFTSWEDELLSLNLLKAHRACEARFSRTDLEEGIAEVSEQLEYRIACIASAVAALDFSAAFEHYCCLYSMLYMVVPLGNALPESAPFNRIRHLDAAYLAHTSARVWLPASARFDPRAFWTEHASGPAGYLQTTTVDAVMQMQLTKLLTIIPSMNRIVDFCYAQTYESMERGLHGFINNTVMRMEQGAEPFQCAFQNVHVFQLSGPGCPYDTSC